MSPRRRPEIQPIRCPCTHATDTAEWQTKHGRGAGLTGRGAALHLAGCVHSDMERTTRPQPKKRTVPRIRLI